MGAQRLTEAQREGLFHGQHGVDPELGLTRLDRRRELELVTLGRAVNSRVSELRSTLAESESRNAAARKHFAILDAEAHGEAPSLWWLMLGLLFSIALTVGDAFLLAPLLQGIGIIDPLDQLLIALLIGAGLTGFVHVGFRLWHSGHRVRSILVLAAVGTAVGSICWWRCDQIVFAASLGNDAWRDFLAAHPMSTRLFVVGLSVILPFAAGFCSSHVLPQLEFSTRWYAARRGAARWGERCDTVRERLKAAETEARLAARDIELRHEIDRIQYRVHHHLGGGGSPQGAEVANHV
jgi:hypothetical protein